MPIFVPMRKLLSISLLAIYLFSNVEFCQLLKIPLFIEHYKEFVDNGDGDLVDFIVHHYGGHEKDGDWDTDMKLPFMTLSTDTNTPFYIPKIQFDIFTEPTFFSENTQPVAKTQSFLSAYFNSILQPPRIG
jgi:hypothetical protein